MRYVKMILIEHPLLSTNTGSDSEGKVESLSDIFRSGQVDYGIFCLLLLSSITCTSEFDGLTLKPSIRYSLKPVTDQDDLYITFSTGKETQ